jgi:copper chaperone CopZ
MSKSFVVLSVAIALAAATAVAQEPVQKTQAEREPTKATYLVTGLHCPPCTRTVESSLQRVKGVRSIKVDWKTKNAQIVFDEALLPAQRVAQLIAATPHMMGGNMQYGGWLALKVPALKDDATAKQVKGVLSKVEGVKQVATYPAQHSVGIAFASKGGLTSAQLIEALAKAGIKAENL